MTAAALFLPCLIRNCDKQANSQAEDRSPADALGRYWFVDQLHARLAQCNGSLVINFKNECARCRQTPSTASERFKERYSITIREYCVRLRMEHAGEALLLDPTTTPNALARRLGYGCGTAVSRVFRAYWGVSPKEYAQCVLANRRLPTARDGHALRLSLRAAVPGAGETHDDTIGPVHSVHSPFLQHRHKAPDPFQPQDKWETRPINREQILSRIGSPNNMGNKLFVSRFRWDWSELVQLH